MTDMQPRFFDTENKLIAHLEWEAIRILCFEGNHMNIADAYPKKFRRNNIKIQASKQSVRQQVM